MNSKGFFLSIVFHVQGIFPIFALPPMRTLLTNSA
jgi:hypothetical protein